MRSEFRYKRRSNTSGLPVFVGMFNVVAAEIDFVPAPGSPLELAGGGHGFVMGDFNRDGKPDLIVCSSNALHGVVGQWPMRI